MNADISDDSNADLDDNRQKYCAMSSLERWGRQKGGEEREMVKKKMVKKIVMKWIGNERVW